LNFSTSKIVNNSIEALSIKYNTLVYEKQRKNEDIVILSLGEAFFEIPLFSFATLPSSKIYHYSHSRGIPELRKKLCDYYFKNYDVKINSETEIIVTAGSKIGIHMSLMSILNPNDEVLIHEPAWVSYTEEVKLCYGKPIHIPYSNSVFDYEDFITEKTKMIILNNPTNPTGKVYSKDELNHILELAKKYDLVILSDEAYSEFLSDKKLFCSIGTLDPEKKYSVIVNSLSKNFGMSGWRLGYVISNKKFMSQLLKVNQHLITCPSTILEYYVVKHFEKIIKITEPQIKKLLAYRRVIMKFMNSINLSYFPGDATYYFFISIASSKLSSDEFAMNLLTKYNISVVPGIGYGRSCDKFIRVSIGTEKIERLEKGLTMIKALIERTS